MFLSTKSAYWNHVTWIYTHTHRTRSMQKPSDLNISFLSFSLKESVCKSRLLIDQLWVICQWIEIQFFLFNKPLTNTTQQRFLFKVHILGSNLSYTVCMTVLSLYWVKLINIVLCITQITVKLHVCVCVCIYIYRYFLFFFVCVCEFV